jgi:hypothetical protein
MSDANEEKLRKRLADSLWLAATSRIINLVGVPAALALGAWMVGTVHNLEIKIEALPFQLEAVQQQIKTTNDRVGSVERRVDRLEQPFFGGKQ